MLWRRLFSSLRALRPLECRVLAHVAAALAPEARRRYEAQVARITGAQQPGRVFSLAFSTAPERLPANAEPGAVRLWMDPMQAGARPGPEALGVSLPAGVSALRSVVPGDAAPTFYVLDAADDGAAPRPVGADYRVALARLS